MMLAVSKLNFGSHDVARIFLAHIVHPLHNPVRRFIHGPYVWTRLDLDLTGSNVFLNLSKPKADCLMVYTNHIQY